MGICFFCSEHEFRTARVKLLLNTGCPQFMLGSIKTYPSFGCYCIQAVGCLWECSVILQRMGNNRNQCIEWQLLFVFIAAETHCGSISYSLSHVVMLGFKQFSFITWQDIQKIQFKLGRMIYWGHHPWHIKLIMLTWIYHFLALGWVSNFLKFPRHFHLQNGCHFISASTCDINATMPFHG